MYEHKKILILCSLHIIAFLLYNLERSYTQTQNHTSYYLIGICALIQIDQISGGVAEVEVIEIEVIEIEVAEVEVAEVEVAEIEVVEIEVAEIDKWRRVR